MSLSSLRITEAGGGRLVRPAAFTRLASIFVFYLVLAICGGFFVLTWYGLFGPLLQAIEHVLQVFQYSSLAYFIWWFAIFLETLLLFRGYRERLLRMYALFYSYILLDLLLSVVGYAVFLYYAPSYRHFYSATRLLGPTAACLVVFQITGSALAEYPGVARLSRSVLLVAFATALGMPLVSILGGSSSLWVIELERNFELVQVAAIAGLIGLFSSYSLPLGKNLKGMLFGYALLAGMNIMPGILVSQFLHQFIWVIVLTIWAISLWSYRPAIPQIESRLEDNYQRLTKAAGTRIRQVLNALHG